MAEGEGRRIKIQNAGTGISYKAHDGEFRTCMFEQSHVDGRNEHYEWKCPITEDCCGDHCCVIEESFAPFWLMIIFIALALLLLLLALATLAYWCSKRKPKPKPPPKPKKGGGQVLNGDARYGYRTGEQTYERSKGYEPLAADEHLEGRALHDSRYGRTLQDDRYDRSLQRSAENGKFSGEKNAHGYINPIYTPKTALRESDHALHHSDRISDRESQNTVIEKTGTDSREHREVAIPIEASGQVRQMGYSDEDGRYARGYDPYRHGPLWRRGDADDRGAVHETYEEKFEEKYSVEEYPGEDYPDYQGSLKRPIKQ